MNAMNPINILYMIDTLGYGGTERQLVELIQGLDRSRFQPHLCTLKPYAVLFDELDVPKICLDFASFRHPSCLNRLWKLSRFIRTHHIQIVQTFFQDSFMLAAMVKPFHNFKLIGSFRDLGFWRTPSASRKMRMAYHFFDGFIANSQAVKDHFVKTDGINPIRIEVIYNGFDLSTLPKVLPSREHGAPPVVGIVANLNRPVKRVQDFIEAAALVRSEVPKTLFVVVGDGHLRSELESLGASLGLGNSILFIGRVEKPLNIVCNFDIGVITSETEGFCNAIIEYMACEVPVVVTNVGGNNEIVRDGENGFLVPVGDCHNIAEKITKLLKDVNAISEIGRAGFDTIRNKFSLENMLINHIEYYNHIVESFWLKDD